MIVSISFLNKATVHHTIVDIDHDSDLLTKVINPGLDKLVYSYIRMNFDLPRHKI